MAGQQYSYTITSQVTGQTVNDSNGNTVVGSYVYFVTGAGNSGVVFVPDNLLTVKHVRESVQAQAKLLDDIGALSETFTA